LRNHEGKDIITNQREGYQSMTKLTLYVASDGTTFDNEPQCKAHEDELNKGIASIVDDDRKRLILSMRKGLDEMRSKINRLKSHTTSQRCLKYLTKEMMDGRIAYKAALKKATFSVESMLELDRVLRKATDAYREWYSAYEELEMLRDKIRIAEDGIYELTYGKRPIRKPKKGLGMLHPYRHHEKRKRKGR